MTARKHRNGEPEGVSGPELAVLLGVTEIHLGKLATAGTLVRTGRNQFDLRASVKGYIKHLQDRIHERKAPEHVKGLAAEKIRKTREEADRVARENAVAAGKLADVEEVTQSLNRTFGAMRDHIQACPTLEEDDKVTLLTELRGILNREVNHDAEREG